ncbi:MAG TPA: DUF5615 family PIN-like protein [Prolixibacteraceae bacterium]|nr:DUF5615 family PIN-like protein [Prolixibacteraceae bacterium]
MKFLFDQNLSPKLASHFRKHCDLSKHLMDISLDFARDMLVWEYAKSNDFTIVTKDSDFNNMVSLFGFPPKVVLIRRRNCSTKLIQSLLEKHLEEIRLFISDNENGIFTIL